MQGFKCFTFKNGKCVPYNPEQEKDKTVGIPMIDELIKKGLARIVEPLPPNDEGIVKLPPNCLAINKKYNYKFL